MMFYGDLTHEVFIRFTFGVMAAPGMSVHTCMIET